MGSRSHSRERERHRSRSPVARSKTHRDERKGKSKHHVKKEHHRDSKCRELWKIVTKEFLIWSTQLLIL